jgi:hypothetical protein
MKKSRSHLIRLAQALVVAPFAAGAIATTATAGPATRPPDVQDAATAASASMPDVIERYAASHPFGLGLSLASGAIDVGRPPYVRDAAAVAVPDALERYVSAHPYGASSPSALPQTIVSRPPDVSDAAAAARTVVIDPSSGFAWNDFAAGIGAGIGAILLVAGSLAAGRLSRRHRAQTA